ncbi:S-layer homology domain-containing protein [Cohnella soli]|uniref:S-layer homology domain-containing protein n=1 Tax=Cohnella soli TaxID=425005 RepID=A0ABW0HWS6_9BACL
MKSASLSFLKRCSLGSLLLATSLTLLASPAYALSAINVTGPIIKIDRDLNIKLPADLLLNREAPLRWKALLGDSLSPPVVGKDGTVYVSVHFNTGDRDYLAALEPHGTVKWSWKAPAGTSLAASQPSVEDDGTVILSAGKKVFAIGPDGLTKWTLDKEVFSTPTHGSDGTIYINDNISVYAVSPRDGSIKWKYGDHGASSPVTAANGILYVAEYDSAIGYTVVALDSNGNKKWTYAVGNKDIVRLKRSADGTILARTPAKIVAIKPSGVLRWELPYTAPSDSWVVGNGVYMNFWESGATPHSRLMSFSPEGKKQWEWSVDKTDPSVNGALAGDTKFELGMNADETLYVATYGYIYAVSSEGKKLWKYADADPKAYFAPVAGPDGTVYAIASPLNSATAQRNVLYAIGTFAATGVTLNTSATTLEAGQMATLTATVAPQQAVNKRTMWRSSDPAVVSVDGSGRIVGVSAGSAVVTVTTEEGEYSASVTVTVTPGSAVPSVFKDVTGHWAAADIAKAFDAKITSGYPDGTFRPEANITRSEFTVMLMNGLKQPGEDPADLAFKDKSKIETWSAHAVAAAVKLGIISGYADGTFKPQGKITHAEMITMVVKASKKPTDSTAISSYADDKAIPGWARGAAALAGQYSLLGGMKDNRFAPAAQSTRAEAVAAIVRMLAIK